MAAEIREYAYAAVFGQLRGSRRVGPLQTSLTLLGAVLALANLTLAEREEER